MGIAALGAVALVAAGAIGHFAFDSATGANLGSVAASSSSLSINASCTKSAESQVAIDRCAEKIENEAQRVLNTALSKERAAIKPSLVNSAETKWMSYRNAECAAYAAVNQGGTIYPTEFSSCEYKLTVKRIEDVQAATKWATM